MPRFSIIIQCDNAAFGDTPEDEVATILEELAAKLRDGPGYAYARQADSFPVRDSNGNRVGSAQWGVE